MFGEFLDGATAKKLSLQYDHILIAQDDGAGATVIMANGGAVVQINVPYAEVSAWLKSCDKEIADDAQG